MKLASLTFPKSLCASNLGVQPITESTTWTVYLGWPGAIKWIVEPIVKALDGIFRPFKGDDI